MRRAFCFVSLAFCLLLPLASRPAVADALDPGADSRADSWAACARHIEAAEDILNLPPKILAAISLAESGRYSKEHSATLAWPWTVMAEGRGRYLPTREAAIAEVEALKARGVRNIDVGCMQINLMYHGEHFDTVEQAFDPAFNIAYAAKYLLDLRRETRSWVRAMTRYHSATPVHAERYRAKVLSIWREARNAAQREHAAERRAQVVERRAAQRNNGGIPVGAVN